jgi:hypothetical protein
MAFLGHGRLPDTPNLHVEATPVNETNYLNQRQNVLRINWCNCNS